MMKADEKKALVQQAVQAQKHAYAPYSNYKVGAALQTKSGTLFRGANVENAVYSLTICAERAAIFSAVSAGEREIDALAVVTRDGGTPCGSCRQVMVEFNPHMVVLIADAQGKIHQETSAAELLPNSFNAQNLESSS